MRCVNCLREIATGRELYYNGILPYCDRCIPDDADRVHGSREGAQPQRIGGPIPEGCAEPSASQRATEAALLDCPPSRPQGMGRHEVLAPKIQAAIRQALVIFELRSADGHSLRGLLGSVGVDAEAESDFEGLVDAISRAVGEVLVREDGP